MFDPPPPPPPPDGVAHVEAPLRKSDELPVGAGIQLGLHAQYVAFVSTTAGITADSHAAPVKMVPLDAVTIVPAWLDDVA
jgi:hypothetical protein